MTALLMEYPQYNPPRDSDVQFQEHHDLDDTMPGNRRGGASEVDMMDSFSPVNDLNIFGMLHDNSYANYNNSSSNSTNINNPSMTSLLFQTPAAGDSPTQACDDGAAFINISPATMWLGSGSPMSTRVADYLRDGSVSAAPNATILRPRFEDQAHMASPSPDEDMSMVQSSNKKNLSRKRRDSQMEVSVNKKERKESTTSHDEGGSVAGGSGHKRDKYREKNRVAAAKCRAKKKDHVDTLEDSHRTQSVLNAALKQTEQSLRDELSYWRTQALQHSFCSCQAIQDYNMRKARNLAAENLFGGGVSGRPRPADVHRTPPVSSPVSSASQADQRQKSNMVTPETDSWSSAGSNDKHAVQTISQGGTLQERRAKTTAKTARLRFDNPSMSPSKGPDPGSINS